MPRPHQPRRIITAWQADFHAGHRLGLCPPDITVYDEDINGGLSPRPVTLTATQEMLWNAFTADVQSVVDLANGDPIYLFFCGDITQGVKHKASLVSTRVADQITIAAAILNHWLQIPNLAHIELVIGTAAHLLGEASAPILVQQAIQPRRPDVPVDLCYHHRPMVHGTIFDAAHHGPSSGIREWTQGNQLRYYAKSLCFHDIHRGRHPPRYIIRAHFHKLWPETISIRVNRALLSYLYALEHHRRNLTLPPFGFEGANIHDIIQAQIILLPAYVGLGEYGRQATGSTPTLSIGTVAIPIEDRRPLRPYFFEREYDIRREQPL